METLVQIVSNAFKQQHQHEPTQLILSPGRINIIGEHVDYNDGFVLPAAINKYVCLAISKSENSQCSIKAIDLNKEFCFDLENALTPQPDMWVNYILGVVEPLRKRFNLTNGFHVVFSSTIPMGSGLSSSAAVECGMAFALNFLFDLGLSKEELAQLGQQAEHHFVGVKCGIMDQFASVFGKQNHVIKLDCTTLQYDYFSANLTDYCLVLLDSKVKHTHLTSGYNTRRQEVEAGLQLIQKAFPSVKTFRDCTLEQVEQVKDALGATLYKRCTFVVGEIYRVEQAVRALNEHNFALLGQLMNATHVGLSQAYEVSCEELDFLVSQAQQEEAVLGARMMGGGFGGCSINLVKRTGLKEMLNRVSVAYKHRFGIDLEVYEVELSDGTHCYRLEN